MYLESEGELRESQAPNDPIPSSLPLSPFASLSFSFLVDGIWIGALQNIKRQLQKIDAAQETVLLSDIRWKECEKRTAW